MSGETFLFVSCVIGLGVSRGMLFGERFLFVACSGMD